MNIRYIYKTWYGKLGIRIELLLLYIKEPVGNIERVG